MKLLKAKKRVLLVFLLIIATGVLFTACTKDSEVKEDMDVGRQEDVGAGSKKEGDDKKAGKSEDEIVEYERTITVGEDASSEEMSLEYEVEIE